MLALAVSPLIARADTRADTCADIAKQTRRTVIAFEPPSAFTICREGHGADDVVAGRFVSVELVPGKGEDLFRYRLSGRSTEPKPSGLAAWAKQARHAAHRLQTLGESSARISELAPPSAGTSPLSQARSQYLGVATPRFDAALEGTVSEARSVDALTMALGRWCARIAEVAITPADLAAELRARCGAPPIVGHREGPALAERIDHFHVARDRARELLIDADAAPSDGAARAAAAALDAAAREAQGVQAESRRLSSDAEALAEDALLLREGVRGGAGALRPGVLVPLGRFTRGGSALLEIEAVTAALLPPGEDIPEASETSMQTFRFSIVPVHLLDLEAGVGLTGGIPPVPAVGSQGGGLALEGKSPDQIVGLALLELEPARFLWPDQPLAGVLRFPVIGLPLTRDPRENFFGGIGLGWTGVGSIAGGPYVVRETTLSPGYSIGQALPSGSTLASVSGPALHVGYFVSANVDLLGLFHLVFPVHEATFDAATAEER